MDEAVRKDFSEEMASELRPREKELQRAIRGLKIPSSKDSTCKGPEVRLRPASARIGQMGVWGLGKVPLGVLQ